MEFVRRWVEKPVIPTRNNVLTRCYQQRGTWDRERWT